VLLVGIFAQVRQIAQDLSSTFVQNIYPVTVSIV